MKTVTVVTTSWRQDSDVGYTIRIFNTREAAKDYYYRECMSALQDCDGEPDIRVDRDLGWFTAYQEDDSFKYFREITIADQEFDDETTGAALDIDMWG